jgi:hypothetical protein
MRLLVSGPLTVYTQSILFVAVSRIGLPSAPNRAFAFDDHLLAVPLMGLHGHFADPVQRSAD